MPFTPPRIIRFTASRDSLALPPAGQAMLFLGLILLLWAATRDWVPAFVDDRRHWAVFAAQMVTVERFPTGLQSDFWQAAVGYAHIVSVQGLQDDALHLALYAADHGMTTNDPFAARYDAAALESERQQLLQELAAGTLRSDTLYLFESEGAFLQAAEPVKTQAWCGEVTSADGASQWYVIAPGLQGQTFDSLCTPYDETYPLRLADYTDALWNRGVLDETKQTVCFADAPFTRAKLENAAALVCAGQTYPITPVDDSDPGWLMVTLDIDDATVLWGQELETIQN